MSRTGNKAVALPAGVEIKQNGNSITVKGPEDELTREFSSNIKMNIEGNGVTFTRPNDSKGVKTIHGATRVNLNNMIAGVSKGFQKTLEPIGVGYHVQVQDNKLTLNVGYSRPVEMTTPEGTTFKVPASAQVIVKGINKKVVGELAVSIRNVRPPEPYEGKGIYYISELVRRKEGETGK